MDIWTKRNIFFDFFVVVIFVKQMVQFECAVKMMNMLRNCKRNQWTVTKCTTVHRNDVVYGTFLVNNATRKAVLFTILGANNKSERSWNVRDPAQFCMWSQNNESVTGRAMANKRRKYKGNGRTRRQKSHPHTWTAAMNPYEVTNATRT